MNTALTMGLAKRMLGLLDRRETDLAPAIMYEPTEVYTSPERQHRERDTIFGRTLVATAASRSPMGPAGRTPSSVGSSAGATASTARCVASPSPKASRSYAVRTTGSFSSPRQRSTG